MKYIKEYKEIDFEYFDEEEEYPSIQIGDNVDAIGDVEFWNSYTNKFEITGFHIYNNNYDVINKKRKLTRGKNKGKEVNVDGCDDMADAFLIGIAFMRMIEESHEK